MGIRACRQGLDKLSHVTVAANPREHRAYHIAQGGRDVHLSVLTWLEIEGKGIQDLPLLLWLLLLLPPVRPTFSFEIGSWPQMFGLSAQKIPLHDSGGHKCALPPRNLDTTAWRNARRP